MINSTTLSDMRAFFVVWFGQFVSMVGSNMTMFALAIWVYQQTGSVTQYAFTLLFTLVPLSLMAPIAGVLIDRWDRRKVMIYADIVSGLTTLVVAGLLFSNGLQVWHIYAAAIVNAMSNSFQQPSFQATITNMVPRSQYGRAAGLLQLAEALSLLIAPPLAGVLLAYIDLYGVILLDFTTFVVALITLASVYIPQPHIERRRKQKREFTLLREIRFGLGYLWKMPGFIALTLFVVFFMQLLLGLAQTLITPLVLSFTRADVFGMVVGAIGTGALVGGVMLSIWGGPRRRMRGIFLFSLPYGIGLILVGVQANVLMIAFGGFIFAISHAMIMGCNRVLWQSKIAQHVQGRVFAMRMLIGVGAQAIGTTIAGPLADRFFEPLLLQGGYLAANLGPLIGIGVGRGIGLMFVLMGMLMLTATLFAYLNPHLRRIDYAVPEAIIRGESKRTAAPNEEAVA